MEKKEHSTFNIFKTKFFRSIFLPIISIFLFISVAIIAIVFTSFSSEINKGIINDRQKQLQYIEDNISNRIKELNSIGYALSIDDVFYYDYLETEDKVAMTDAIRNYLIGNSFINQIAFYRNPDLITESTPDNIYTSYGNGTYLFSEFWQKIFISYDITKEEFVEKITNDKSNHIIPLTSKTKESYFVYVYPLSQLTTTEAKAFVLMFIPQIQIVSLLQTQLLDSNGEIVIYDAKGNEIYKYYKDNKDILNNVKINKAKNVTEYVKYDGSEYVVQKETSTINSWQYISFLNLDDLISGLAHKQIVFIVLVISLMFLSVIIMLVCVIIQYKPISALATSVTSTNKIQDERVLLSNTIAMLKDDSKQKQIYENAYHEADASNKAKSAFLSSMSHDIRTPMNAIIGMTSLALKHLDEPEYVRDCLQKASTSSKYLLDIINNVLDMSKIESGKFVLLEEIIELPNFINNLNMILLTSINEKNHKFKITIDNIENEIIMGDFIRLTQIFVNIISNSIKFTPDGGKLSLTIKQIKSEDSTYGNYVFIFEDNGIGMSEEFVSQVFDAFSRAKESGISKVEGTGLGMAIVKSLVEMMDGTIECESKLNVGTKFTVRLKFKYADALTEENSWKDFEQFSTTPILIVGNEEDCNEQKLAFAKIGIQVDVATNHDIAIEKCIDNKTTHDYKLVIINQSDSKDDINIITNIYNVINNEKTDIIYITTDLTKVNQVEAKKAGVKYFAQSPLFRSSILLLLNNTYKSISNNDSEEKVIDLNNMRVLLVEDNDINRELARKIIIETNANVIEACNGKKAVEIFTNNPVNYFDIILMDVRMPIMDGYEATKTIRSLNREDANNIPIYALTANTFDEDVRKALEYGMNGHIAKPYTPKMLYDILKINRHNKK